MKLNNLNDLLIHELKDIYNAEQQITKALPKMMKATSSNQLKKAFEDHLMVTEQQIERLEKVFELMGEKAKGEKCKAMEGIIREAESMMEERADASVMDAALIASAQRVEHYEIAAYGTVCTYAKQLGMNDVLKLLLKTLDEEKKTDELLTTIAESSVNIKAER
ncbi:ferritin-like domain-containing protein [Pontibacter sp. BT310]|jgi:ferritin-like metal-binding protein YciE|uniref:Ferritin-like domain-containing protein n=1 Tax=Pontibacter populi TaxID=890055 RepID=A0ABS6XG37_9BACT|nr:MULTISPECIES: ferritin-like domain-containing protein [Pontibacter]MBJ6119756.1 ferritin-like domain-containing protein [Pontibacter sp. BT310]MBR0572185.1 ferritin-like domain-containing protein [Microvirga sp. STS03]MBW3366609.1 ferritin-like domain-containing protein [Pontibacter populi]